MSYHALARKYRPATFADVVGQKHVTDTLRAALRKDKLSHAYLFAGPRGCGKTTVARLLAKALNCSTKDDGDPCGQCETCEGIAAGTYLDVLEIDAASNTGVDNIRDLRDMAQYSPTRGKSRVFIIDEVHMLSKGAFNALLKILEEPPARVFFFFATTEPTKIPRTILSRCQRFDFRLLTRHEVTARLEKIAAAENVRLADSGLRVLVSLAEGSMRDALSLLDQLIAACEDTIDEDAIVQLLGLVRSEVYSELNEALIARDPRRALRLLDRLATAGENLDVFAQGIIVDFRNLLLIKIDPELAADGDLSPEQLTILGRQAESFQAQDLLALIDRAIYHFERIHRSSQPRILLEAALVEFTLFESRVLLADLVRQLTETGISHAGGSEPGMSGPSAGEPGGAATGRGSSRSGSASARASAADTVAGWTGFVQVLLDSHPGLASCLMEGLPSLDPEKSRLIIGFPEDKTFQLERLRQEQQILEERAVSYWKRPVKVELMTTRQDGARDLREDVRQEVTPSQQENLLKACREDQRLADLVNLLQGEVLPDTECQFWQRADQDGLAPTERSEAADPAAEDPAEKE